MRLLSYDPDSGVFRWRFYRCWLAKQGEVAGSISRYGYVMINVDRVPQLAHRLAWLYVKRSWPTGDLDHRDRNKQNNRIGNLRPAKKGQNNINADPPSNNRSGVRGVSRFTGTHKWRATINCNHKQHHLGLFPTKAAAALARRIEERRLFGGFARG